MVPALTLTGTPGTTLRLDHINPIGPVDAWVVLDTVRLTYSPQFYFDIEDYYAAGGWDSPPMWAYGQGVVVHPIGGKLQRFYRLRVSLAR